MITRMSPELAIKTFALEWIDAWNSRNLDTIMSHYDDDVVLTSPVAAKLLNRPSGIVRGKLAVREYFRRGVEVYPDLNFELLDVMHGLHSIVICYRNQKGTRTAEFMELGEKEKIIRVVANYSI